MLKYSANDIVEKAMALADLQNSDFITFKEKIQYLNDSYVSMYNKMIDYGDNLFTEIVKVSGDESELPSDFYQLREVFVMHNKNKTLITPKPLNQSLNDLSYELINNTLKIYGRHEGELFYSYYKVPQTLIVAPERKDITLIGAENEITVNESMPDVIGKIIAFYKDWYIYFLGKNAIMRNIKDSTIKKVIHFAGLGENVTESDLNESDPTFKFFNKKRLFTIPINQNPDAISNTSMIINSTDNHTAMYSIPLNNDVVIVNNEQFFLDPTRQMLKTYSCTEGINPSIDKVIPIDFEMPSRINNMNVDIIFFPYGLNKDLNISFNFLNYKIGNGEVKSFNDYLQSGERITQFWIDNDDKELGDSVVFMTSLNRMFGLNVESETPVLLKEIDKDLVFVGFDGFDAQSGYGLVCYDMAREKFVMESAFDTTELIFPNNTYFTLIAYQLAILFCQKQNKDCTMLMTELQNQIDRFYDSLHRDETSFRITNVDGGYNY